MMTRTLGPGTPSRVWCGIEPDAGCCLYVDDAASECEASDAGLSARGADDEHHAWTRDRVLTGGIRRGKDDRERAEPGRNPHARRDRWSRRSWWERAAINVSRSAGERGRRARVRRAGSRRWAAARRGPHLSSGRCSAFLARPTWRDGRRAGAVPRHRDQDLLSEEDTKKLQDALYPPTPAGVVRRTARRSGSGSSAG